MPQFKFFRVLNKFNNAEGRFRFSINEDLNSVENLLKKIASRLGGFEVIEIKEDEIEDSNDEQGGSVADEQEEEMNNIDSQINSQIDSQINNSQSQPAMVSNVIKLNLNEVALEYCIHIGTNY